MSIIPKARKCISFIIAVWKTTILLFVAMDLCVATNEPIGITSAWNASFKNALDNGDFLQLSLNGTDKGPYLALSSFDQPVDPSFVALINPFWLKFKPAPVRAHYALGIVHSCIMLIGLFGNALVIFMFIWCRPIRTPCNILVLNLAISDFFMLAKAPIVIYNSFKLGPALGEYVCSLYGFVGGLTGTASISTLTAISIDRYNVVVYPLDPQRYTTRHRSYIMVFIVWCYSLIFSIIPALNIGLSKYVPEGYLTSCSFDYLDKTTGARIFMFVFFIFAWFIPFTTITYCYTYILKAVSSSRHIRSSKDNNKTEIKLSIIVIGVIILWFVAWTPYSIVALLGISGNEDKITPFGSMIPAVFCKASACINPYIYSITHPKFRLEFSRLFLGRNQSSNFKTSYYRCNPTCPSTVRRSIDPSIVRKQLVSNVETKNCTKLQDTLKEQNLQSENQIEYETNPPIKVEHFDKRNDKKSVVIVVIESCPEEKKLVAVVET